jgi:hypothetical protein
MGYVIGSTKGQAIANLLKEDETYKASDGSTWKKNADGTVTVTDKAGGVTQNALPADSFKGSATGVVANNATQQAQVDMLNKNSLQWWTADDAGKQALSAANQALGAALGGSVAYDPTTGTWSGVAGTTPATQSADVLSNIGSFSYDVAQPTYESQYSDRIDAMLNEILNREKFSYDVEADPLYQQYKTQYLREGDRSMRDTLAAAASGAGGMNSYAVTAAQQANDYYAAQLGDKIPELYQLAYEMYLTDIDNQVRDLGLLQDMDNTQYGRYRDTMSDWRNDRDFAYGQYRDNAADLKWGAEFDESIRQWQTDYERNALESDRNYNRDVYESDRKYNRGVYEWDTSFDYGKDRDAVKDQNDAWDKALTILQNGGYPSDELLEAAGMSAAEANSIREAQTIVFTGGGGSDGTGGSGGSGGGDEPDDTPVFNNDNGSGFTEKHAAAVKAAPDRTSADVSDLSSKGKSALQSLSMMYDSISNQYPAKDGMYPVEKTILAMAAEGSITADDGYILMQHFGYDGEKHFPEG